MQDSDISSGEWHNLISIEDLYQHDVTPALLNNLQLAVYDTKNGITVSEAKCTHAGASLCDGYFDGNNIECPLHQGLFDATTGAAKAAPVTRALVMYESRVVNGIVQIKL